MSARQIIDWSDAATCAFDLVAREFVVVTADGADLKAFSPLCALLRRMRKALGLEAAFISEASDGVTIVRCHDDRADGACDPLQSLFGQRLLAETVPESCGNIFEAVPVITNDGMEHGTLCFRIGGADSGKAPDLAALRSVARLIANWFEEAELSLSGFTPLTGASVMGSLSATVY